MKAKCRVIYRESKATYRRHSERFEDAVFVSIREWTSYDAQDTVIDTRVYIDGKLEVNSRKVLPESYVDASVLQRMGIAEFDKHLAAHPTLGKIASESAT